MDVLTLFRRMSAAKSDLEGLRSVAKMQSYNRLDERSAELALVILMREDETADILFRDLDAVVAGVAELRAEILARKASAAAVQK